MHMHVNTDIHTLLQQEQADHYARINEAETCTRSGHPVIGGVLHVSHWKRVRIDEG